MKVYDKLVRDRIPDIIEASGKKCDVEVVNDEVALEYLYKKLEEEVSELLEDRNLEEISDCMEVLFGIAYKMGYSEEEVLRIRDEKMKKNGGFKEGILLKCVY